MHWGPAACWEQAAMTIGGAIMQAGQYMMPVSPEVPIALAYCQNRLAALKSPLQGAPQVSRPSPASSAGGTQNDDWNEVVATGVKVVDAATKLVNLYNNMSKTFGPPPMNDPNGYGWQFSTGPSWNNQ
jgi:hypothetical protein